MGYSGHVPRRRIAFALASLLGHALLLGSAMPGGPWDRRGEAPLASAVRLGPTLVSRTEAALRPERLRRAREALVAEARAQRRAGKLSLGAFLLRAGHIDAEEAGEGFR